ncbi:unnamed protein product, partial [Mesorhabditis belari]|uniref:Uncharacterized protein n=1 Tax=Mesorhabditis belari TaxID=2138241 RepID=A0AAF3F3Z1_9BILA
MSLVEVVAAERKSGRRLNFNDPSTFSRFLNDINIDLKKIGNIVARKQLKFVDDYLALYHYRKHGEEFMTHCSLQFHLGELPSKVVNQGKLVDVCEMNMMAQNGVQEVIHQKTYYLPNDEMCVPAKWRSINKEFRSQRLHHWM